MKAEDFIKSVKEADITDTEWIYNIVDNMKRSYAKGVIKQKISELTNSIETTTEYFREEMLEIAENDIWN